MIYLESMVPLDKWDCKYNLENSGNAKSVGKIFQMRLPFLGICLILH